MSNYCIILAGGAGRRLWPISTEERPKQFIDFFGTGRSLLQMTYDRFLKIIPSSHIVVVTQEEYATQVREQLPDLPEANIISENVRLGTAPAAIQASRYIEMFDSDACVVVTPADQFIVGDDTFVQEIQNALQRLRVTAPERFMALAVQATHPHTSYGYIQKGEAIAHDLYRVKTFTEKPDREFAQMFVQSDEFLWNTGLFLWHTTTMSRLAGEMMDEVAMRQLDGMLLDTHREKVVVQECHFGWSDVGCWPRMHEVSHKDVDGNTILGTHDILLEGCSGNTLAIAPGTQVVVKGLKDYLVSYNNGTLVIIPNDDDMAVKHLQTRFLRK